MSRGKPFAITLDPGTSLRNKTGSWRTERPVWKTLLPPCNHSCPIGENIQGWLSLAEKGLYFEAWQELVQTNPFPACMGRACYHFCEKGCNRLHFDETVNIHAVERFLGDRALQEQWAFPPPLSPQRSQKVLVVGAGPSGLSAAYHLARRGYQVTICERREEAGGLLRYGIPPYRLPKDIVRAEIQRLLSVGMALRLNTEVSSLEEVQHEFAACYLALGAGRARTVPGLEEARIIDALDFLRHVETFPRFSGFVAVYGGGNTAFDAARTAIRLGATRVVVLYRGAQERLSAHPEEITLAQQEGVEILPLRMITEFSDEGKLTLEVREPVEAGKTKSSGRTEHLSVERLILAIGQEVEAEGFSKLARQEGGGGMITVDRHCATSIPGVFSGGDMVPSGRTLAESIGHGRRAAVAIEAYLEKRELPAAEKQAKASLDKLNTYYYEPVPQQKEARQGSEKRPQDFREVFATLSEEEAVREARRCFSCGRCFQCDTCYGVCPDNAICKGREAKDSENGLAFDYNYCKGCGLCARECPCGFLQMVPEER